MGRNKARVLAFWKALGKAGFPHPSLLRLLPWWQPTPKMTGFLRQLAATPYRWQSGLIRTDEEDCPITAVARHLTGRKYSLGAWEVAAAAIGLPQAEARLVVGAADNELNHIAALRARLLAATVKRSAVPRASAPAPDQMDRELAALIAEGPAESTSTEVAAV